MSINPELLASSDYYVEALARKTGVVYPNKPEWNAGDASYPDAPFDLTFSGGGGAYHYNASRLLSPATADVPVLEYDADGNVLGLVGFGQVQNVFRGATPLAVEGGVGVRATYGASTFPAKYGFNGMVTLTPSTPSFNVANYTNTGVISGTYSLFFLAKASNNAVLTASEVKFFVNASAVPPDNVYSLGENVYLFVRNGQAITTSNATNGVLVNTDLGYTVDVSAISFVAGTLNINEANWQNYFVDTSGAVATAIANITTGDIPTAITSATAISGACVVNVPANISGVEQTIFELHDETADNSIKLYINTSNRYALRIVDGGGTPVEIVTATLPVNQNVGLSWEVGASIMRLSMNGSTEDSETVGVTLPTVTNIHLMSNRTPATRLNGYMRLTSLKGALVGETILNDWSTVS